MPSLTDRRTDQPQPESSAPQRLSQPEGVDWPDNNQERTLADFFLELVHSGPPSPLPRPSPPSVDRVWAPQSLGGPPPDDGRFTARHPEFTFGGIDCPTRAIGRAPRNSMRGRQGRFHSRKMKRTLRARSDLEFDMFLLCELDPAVDAYIEQPLRLRYPLDGRTRWHMPDLFVLRAGVGTFMAIIPEGEAALADRERRWPAIGATLALSGYVYCVQTERHIRRQPRFSTLRTLFADRHAPLPDGAMRRRLALAVPAGATIAISALLAGFPQLAAKHIHSLIVNGYLATSLDAPLGPTSRVWQCRQSLNGPGLGPA